MFIYSAAKLRPGAYHIRRFQSISRVVRTVCEQWNGQYALCARSRHKLALTQGAFRAHTRGRLPIFGLKSFFIRFAYDKWNEMSFFLMTWAPQQTHAAHRSSHMNTSDINISSKSSNRHFVMAHSLRTRNALLSLEIYILRFSHIFFFFLFTGSRRFCFDHIRLCYL